MKKSQKSNTLFLIEFEREADRRWIAEIPKLSRVMAYGNTNNETRQKVYVIALRTLADKVEHGHTTPIPITQLFTYEMARG